MDFEAARCERTQSHCWLGLPKCCSHTFWVQVLVLPWSLLGFIHPVPALFPATDLCSHQKMEVVVPAASCCSFLSPNVMQCLNWEVLSQACTLAVGDVERGIPASAWGGGRSQEGVFCSQNRTKISYSLTGTCELIEILIITSDWWAIVAALFWPFMSSLFLF